MILLRFLFFIAVIAGVISLIFAIIYHVILRSRMRMVDAMIEKQKRLNDDYANEWIKNLQRGKKK